MTDQKRVSLGQVVDMLNGDIALLTRVMQRPGSRFPKPIFEPNGVYFSVDELLEWAETGGARAN